MTKKSLPDVIPKISPWGIVFLGRQLPDSMVIAQRTEIFFLFITQCYLTVCRREIIFLQPLSTNSQKIHKYSVFSHAFFFSFFKFFAPLLWERLANNSLWLKGKSVLVLIIPQERIVGCFPVYLVQELYVFLGTCLGKNFGPEFFRWKFFSMTQGTPTKNAWPPLPDFFLWGLWKVPKILLLQFSQR